DRASVNDAMFYFLARKIPAVHDLHFDPLVTTTGQVQRGMIADLERTKPLVVLWTPREEAPGPAGATRLDQHLRDNYRFLKSFGDYVILQRNTMGNATSGVNSVRE